MGEEDLEQVLTGEYDRLGIAPEQRETLDAYLNLVKVRDYETWAHSVRVGKKGAEIAKFLHMEPKALFYAGLLHDVGKIESDPKTLKKTEGWENKDTLEMRKHPIASYKMLRGQFDFSAQIALRHHRFVGKGYPQQLPKCPVEFGRGTQTMIDFYARVLGLVDFYDAITHRENDKFSTDGKPRVPTPEEAKDIIIKANPDQAFFINELYEARMF